MLLLSLPPVWAPCAAALCRIPADPGLLTACSWDEGAVFEVCLARNSPAASAVLLLDGRLTLGGCRCENCTLNCGVTGSFSVAVKVLSNLERGVVFT